MACGEGITSLSQHRLSAFQLVGKAGSGVVVQQSTALAEVLNVTLILRVLHGIVPQLVHELWCYLDCTHRAQRVVGSSAQRVYCAAPGDMLNLKVILRNSLIQRTWQ